MHEDVTTFSEHYRRVPLTPYEGCEDGTNVVKLANYREVHYAQTFKTFMQQWKLFTEDHRERRTPSPFPLHGAFSAFTLETTVYTEFLKKGTGRREVPELMRVRRIIRLLEKLGPHFSKLSLLDSLVHSEMCRCFDKIDDVFLKLEDEFGMIVHKRSAHAVL